MYLTSNNAYLYQILHGTKDELYDILGSALKSSDVKGLHAQCLTDIWIGRDRSAMIFS
jgi:hypothetical protein